ncbi:flagellar hook-length control protein FliK, partial [Orrella sp. JC864]
MSVGNSALGTLLVQRLDAVLGTTMAQHANLISGARPDAVSQAGSVARLLGPEPTAPRNERETLERTRVDGIRGGAGKQVDQSSEQALRAAAGRLRQTSTAFTASAPTSLGVAARTILALLARFPEPAPPAAGRAPLWSPPAGAGPMPGGTAPAGPASGGAPAAPAAGPASAASAA